MSVQQQPNAAALQWDGQWMLIFQYASLSDRSRVSRVCSTWYTWARNKASWSVKQALHLSSCGRMSGDEPQFHYAKTGGLWLNARALKVNVPPDATSYVMTCSEEPRKSQRRRRFDASTLCASRMPVLERLSFSWNTHEPNWQLPMLQSAAHLRHLTILYGVSIPDASLVVLTQLESLYMENGCSIESAQPLHVLTRLKTLSWIGWTPSRCRFTLSEAVNNPTNNNAWALALNTLIGAHALRKVTLDFHLFDNIDIRCFLTTTGLLP